MNARARRPFHNSVIVPLRFLANPFFVHPQYFIAYTRVSEPEQPKTKSNRILKIPHLDVSILAF